MKAESIVIHKGAKEEKYRICVEDYVISYLKYETGTLNLSGISFYGYREQNGKEYIIYGAGRDKHLAIFDKYELLDKITCSLTQGGPVFMVREEDGLYEVKGYDIFYYKNEEMQNYLIDRKQQNKTTEKAEEEKAGQEEYKQSGKGKAEQEEHTQPGRRSFEQTELPGRRLHNTMSLQLGVIFVILIAIVINSANSYDKMKQLNQSAQEVFFAIENQEAEGLALADGTQEQLVVERETLQNDAEEEAAELTFVKLEDEISENEAQQKTEEEPEGVLKSADTDAIQETAEQEAQRETDAASEQAQQQSGLAQAAESDADAEEQPEPDSVEEEQQGTEALSRNVTRYYEIERGDTLYTISEEIYGDSSKVKEICELNQISDPDNIRYGQKIILP